MSSTLQLNLKNILSEKERHLTPNKLLKGTTVLGIEGAYDGSYIDIVTPSFITTKNYIENNGTNTYYNTGIKLNQDSEVIIKYAGCGRQYSITGVKQTTNSYLYHLFGYRYRAGSSNQKQFCFSDYNGGNFGFGTMEINVGTANAICDNDWNNVHQLKLNKNGIYDWDETNQQYVLLAAFSGTTADFETGDITLFGRNTYYTSSSPSRKIEGKGYARVYFMEVYQNGVLTHKLTPAYYTATPPSNVDTGWPLGFYDEVTCRFLLPKSSQYQGM